MSTSTNIPPPIDWEQTPLPEYKGCYAKVIDGLFTPSECTQLLDLATSPPPAPTSSILADLQTRHATPPNPETGRPEWQAAAVHYGLGARQNYVDTDYRNSERILRFDTDAAEWIWGKIKPVVQEIAELRVGEDGMWGDIVRRGRKGDVWKLVGVNERLSYLHYNAGNYFRTHCDGNQDLPDGRKARVTIQIYLSGPEPQIINGETKVGLKGGATRFTTTRPATNKVFLDVEPKVGRVLIFQHMKLWHAGMDVLEGEKFALRTDLFYRVFNSQREEVAA